MVASEGSIQPKRERGAVRLRLLEAAETCLLRDGYAGLSTRAVAEAAQTQLSQIHYHFGSKQGLVLSLLEHQNEKLLRRQAAMFGQRLPISARWLKACDHLDEDLNSGYVRVLQEIIAAGYSDAEVAEAARRTLTGWFTLLTQLADEARSEYGGLAGLTNAEAACLVGLAFMGAESMILIGMEGPIRESLRAVGHALEALEQRRGADAS